MAKQKTEAASKQNKLIVLIGLISSIIAIGGFIGDLLTGWPFRPLMLAWTHNVVSVHDSPDFTIEALETHGGTILNPPDRFSYKFDIPLDARGTTTLNPADHVWVVLKDEYGGYYLQNPPADLKTGRWETYNIRPLEGIRQILWLQVDQSGHEFFSRKAQAGEWGKFTSLPEGAREIACVTLK